MTQQQRMQLQLNKQEEQIEDLFKSVREIKNMNLKFMSMGKGLLIGFGLAVFFAAAAGSFGVFLLVSVGALIWTALTSGPLLIMLQNNSLLREIRDNTKND